MDQHHQVLSCWKIPQYFIGRHFIEYFFVVQFRFVSIFSPFGVNQVWHYQRKISFQMSKFTNFSWIACWNENIQKNANCTRPRHRWCTVLWNWNGILYLFGKKSWIFAHFRNNILNDHATKSPSRLRDRHRHGSAGDTSYRFS